jgi:hypothetical protein
MRSTMAMGLLALVTALAMVGCGGDDAAPGLGSGETCGGFRGAMCGSDYYCDFADSAACGAADGIGTCQPRPDVCTPVELPVCGCDGQRYGSACEAHRAGVDDQPASACR